MEDEIEVETSLVFTKMMKLRMVTAATFSGEVKVYECEKPYAMIFMIESNEFETIRTDVFKKDLAEELKACLEGKVIRNPAVLVSVRIEENMMKFIKFGKTPKQEDLIMWMLSRSELYPPLNNGDEHQPMLFFGGKPEEPVDHAVPDLEEIEQQQKIKNNYTKTSIVAAAKYSQDDYPYLIHSQKKNNESNSGSNNNEASENLSDKRKQTTIVTTADIEDRIRPQSTGRLGQSARMGTSARQYDDLGTYAMTKKLLGKSATLEALKQTQIKGRKDAKTTVSTMNWTHEHWRLCQEIEQARKSIEEKMEARRKMIEVSKARQLQKAERLTKIRTEIAAEQGGSKFMKQAIAELATLQKIEENIESNILQQKAHIHRDSQQVFWTMAPSGFQNRRGKSQRGPVLGDGPLPPNATSSLKNPDIVRTMRHYYWDMAGRRHAKDPNLIRTEQEENLIEQAMNAIKRASQNLSLYRLNLLGIFQQFDINGDGYLSASEMCEAFLQMGIKLDIPSAKAIFQYFDRNGSGSVHYGEFVWAFFNRRQLISQWKQKTNHLTMSQIQSIFHQADINGNGRLSYKEFAKLLTKSFGMVLSKEELEILIQHFDVDEDGEIDLYEFIDFIESEQHSFGGSGSMKRTEKDKTASSKRSSSPVIDRPRTPRSSSQPRPTKTSQLEHSNKPKTTKKQESSQLARKKSFNATAPGNIEASAIKAERKSSFHTINLAFEDTSQDYTMRDCEQALRSRQKKRLVNTASARIVRNFTLSSPSRSTSSHTRNAFHSEDEGHSDDSPERNQEQGPETTADHSVSVSSLPGYDAATAGSSSPLHQSVDVMWMAKMLQTQAEIESRLGRKYYKNT